MYANFLFAFLVLAGAGLGQIPANNECVNATPIGIGTLTGQSNVGATTSYPFLCGFADNDVWYSFTAPFAGRMVAHTCASGVLDTVLEIIDGSGGCAGGNGAFGCNDDFCGSRSQVTADVPAGTHFIRVGGYLGATGTFDLTVNLGFPAAVAPIGSGCGQSFGSFYELMASANFDLSGQTLTMTPAGAGYLCTLAAGTIAPVGSVGAVTNLVLADDDQTTAGTLGLWIGSNCWVATGPGNSNSQIPTIGQLLGNPSAAFYSWRDLDPSTGAVGSGAIRYEQSGTLAQITYDGVWAFGTTQPNTIQFRIDTATPNPSATITWGTISTNPSDVLVGYSPAGASPITFASDVSSFAAAPLQLLGDNSPLELQPTPSFPRPIQGPVARNFQVTTTNIPTSALIHVGIVGLSSPGLPLDLPLGASGCVLHASLDVLVSPTFFPPSQQTWTALSLPSLPPSFAGFAISAQSAVLGTPLNSALGPGLLTSNGLYCVVGTL